MANSPGARDGDFPKHPHPSNAARDEYREYLEKQGPEINVGGVYSQIAVRDEVGEKTRDILNTGNLHNKFPYLG